MSWKGLTISAACLLIAGVAMAEKVPVFDETNAPPMNVADECDLTDYKPYEEFFEPPFVWTSTGAASGQIDIADDGTTFDDIVVDLDVSHTWLGDLVATVSYDVECDGTAEASASVMNRNPANDGSLGCSDNILGAYLFTDNTAADVLGGATCDGADEAPGCYKSFDLLGVFNGLPKGGCFTLSVTDDVGGDGGEVRGWSIHALNGPPQVPTQEATWSQIKAIY